GGDGCRHQVVRGGSLHLHAHARGAREGQGDGFREAQDGVGQEGPQVRREGAMRRLLALTLVAMGVYASPANADQVVNTLGDAGTGGCTASECTLREAVDASIGANDPVILPAGTYNLTQG